MFVDRLEGTIVEVETTEKPVPVVRTHGSLEEAREALDNRNDLRVTWNDREWEEFKVEPIVPGAPFEFAQIEDELLDWADRHGYEIIGLDDQFRAIVFSMQLLGAPNISKSVKVLKTELKGSRYSLRKPANMRFAHKPKRVEVLGEIVKAWDKAWSPEYADITDLDKAWVDRLFDEGMIQRSNKTASLVRPTVAGIKWYRRGIAKMAARS